MSGYLSTFIKLASVIITLSISSCSHADAKQDITDARHETQIWTTYALSPYLRASDIKVNVHNGKAILTGKVDEEVNKDLAKQIALGVDGIKEVDNKITVHPDFVPKNSTSYGETIDDVTITAGVKSRLFWSKHSYLGTKVGTKRGRVFLTGTVDSKEARDFAGSLASNTRGVRAVKNQLVIQDKPKPGDTVKNVASETTQTVADAWITTKVKSNFFYSSNVSGSEIAVDTKAGAVKLKGSVDNNAERERAIELAQNVRGVKSVDAKALAVN